MRLVINKCDFIFNERNQQLENSHDKINRTIKIKNRTKKIKRTIFSKTWMCRVAFCFLFANPFPLLLRRQWQPHAHSCIQSDAVHCFLKVDLGGASHRYEVEKGSVLLAVLDNCYYSLILHQSLTSGSSLQLMQYGMWSISNKLFVLCEIKIYWSMLKLIIIMHETISSALVIWKTWMGSSNRANFPIVDFFH